MPKRSDSHFIQEAIKHKGALRSKAAASGGIGADGRITESYLKDHDSGNSHTARQARFAETLRSFRHKSR